MELNILKIKAIGGYVETTPNGGNAILAHDTDHEKMLAYRSPNSDDYNWIHKNFQK